MKREHPLAEEYRVLELEPGAPLEEVKAAFRRLARRQHPDRYEKSVPLKKRANEAFARVNDAYHKLKDYIENPPQEEPPQEPEEPEEEETPSGSSLPGWALSPGFVIGAGLALAGIIFVAVKLIVSLPPSGLRWPTADSVPSSEILTLTAYTSKGKVPVHIHPGALETLREIERSRPEMEDAFRGIFKGKIKHYPLYFDLSKGQIFGAYMEKPRRNSPHFADFEVHAIPLNKDGTVKKIDVMPGTDDWSLLVLYHGDGPRPARLELSAYDYNIAR
ncbi:J domain-containing protein [Elusimicrobiota bacterium]